MYESLKEKLKDWTDIDGAAFQLGIVMGVFPPDQDFQKVKYVFWTNNEFGHLCVMTLRWLDKIGILVSRDGGEQYKWNTAFDMEGVEMVKRPETDVDSVNRAVLEAVSALYFADSSDYRSALVGVVKALDPDLLDLLGKNESAAHDIARKRVYPDEVE